MRKTWLKCKVRQISNVYRKSNDITLCYVFPYNYLRKYDYGLVDAIHELYPKDKVIYFFADLIAIDAEKQRCINSENESDIIYSYDLDEAIKYQLLYHALPYSDISYIGNGIKCSHDICFVGQAKNRIDLIIDAYEYLSSYGVDCDFYIVGAPKEKQKHPDRIHYVDQFFSYKDTLKITAKSRCILEIVQNGSSGHTPRVPEAIMMGKRLLSNNSKLKDDELYDSDYMSIFNKVEEISIDFVKNNTKADYKFDKYSLSPIKLVEDIQKDLERLNYARLGFL